MNDNIDYEELDSTLTTDEPKPQVKSKVDLDSQKKKDSRKKPDIFIPIADINMNFFKIQQQKKLNKQKSKNT